MSHDTKHNTDNLIETLCDDLCEIKVMRHPCRRIVPWIIFAVAYIGLAISIIGLRYDFFTKIHEAFYIFELLLVLAISLSAALCSSWLCVPDMRGQKWLLAVPLSLFCAFLTWILLRGLMENYVMPGVHFHKCYLDAIVFGVLPAAAIWFLSMKGKTTHPYLLSFMNALAIGGLGYIGLRITCGSDSIGHVLTFHILPYVIFGVVAGIIGRRIYHW